MSQKEFWDNKALDFPRYDEKNDKFQQKLIGILKEKKMLTKDSTVIDIGCGTGVYTIPIAKEAKNVLALDISTNMIESLQEDSWNHNVNKKIETKLTCWSEFESEEKFDLVFASLSAAFTTNDDFEKILKHSKGYVCFLDFVDTKGSNFEEVLFDNFRIDKFVYKDLENIKKWLNLKKINYETVPLINNYSKLIDIDLAIEKIEEQIRFSKKDIDLTKNEILNLLKSFMVNGKVKNELNMKLELIYWKNS